MSATQQRDVTAVATGGERVTCSMQMSQLSVRKDPICSAALRLKMADGESSLGTGLSGGPERDGPAAKRSKVSPGTKSGFAVAEADLSPRVPADGGSREAAGNCAQPAEKEAKPVMAVEQAPAASGGDNNGPRPLLPEPRRPSARLGDSGVLGTTEEGAGMNTSRAVF